ncbi:unnamed protein product [Echinostoma caproni]|uniref:Shugoshin_C domain-containing protein n=1 Tax=Echinostoma caproni TaxID=27848 RepID=A0A183BDH3_9TREM|nr:unnamed protein product [Echinostoma caproni]
MKKTAIKTLQQRLNTLLMESTEAVNDEATSEVQMTDEKIKRRKFKDTQTAETCNNATHDAEQLIIQNNKLLGDLEDKPSYGLDAKKKKRERHASESSNAFPVEDTSPALKRERKTILIESTARTGQTPKVICEPLSGHKKKKKSIEIE